MRRSMLFLPGNTPNILINGDALGAKDVDRMVRLLDLAAETGCPVVTFYQAAGAKLAEGLDAQKFGKQWVVTRAAMEREYGPQPQ